VPTGTTELPVPASGSAPITAAVSGPASVTVTPPTASSQLLNVLAKWQTSFYGFVEADSIWDSTQGLSDLAGNSLLARPGYYTSGGVTGPWTPATYAAQHGQVTFGVRNTRLGFRLAAPEWNGVKSSAQIEGDFLGNQPPTATEAQTFNNPAFRIRHAFLKAETPIVDVLFGQTWELFGWQSTFHPASVQIQGLPGQVYSRTPQLRVSKTFKTSPVNVDVAVAALRPPQRGADLPDFQGGLKLSFNDWTGWHTNGGVGSQLDALQVGVSGTVRKFQIPSWTTLNAKGTNYVTATSQDVSATGWGFSLDALVPVIPATKESHANALTLNGSFVRGAGINDLYTSLTGGVSQAAFLGTGPACPAAGPFKPPCTTATAYNAGIDNGLVGFGANGTITAVDWQSWLVGVQYSLPVANLFVAANYSHMISFNAALFGTNTKTVNQSDFADGMLFWDATNALRFGLEYAWFQQQYVDGVHAPNRRVQLSGFFIF
jgi:hypothetical protein